MRELIKKCDELIRAGQIRPAAALLQKLNLVRVPRELRGDLAKICRRAGLLDHGLRLLQPLIRNERALDRPATAAEICEYAVLLSRKGSIREALVLLAAVDNTVAPESLLYQGFCHISDWNYESSIGYLTAYLETSADAYSKLIARVNLGSALLSTSRLDEGEAHLSESIAIARTAGASRLVGNCLEMRGQIRLQRDDFSGARADLAAAFEIFGASGSYDQLLIHKWQAVLTALESRQTEPLQEFRREAIEKRHWESVREADLFFLKVRFNQELFDHLYFGTPKRAYRDRMRSQLHAEPSSSYVLGQGDVQLNLLTGETDGAPPVRGKSRELLAALAQDLYAPRNLGTLFSELYPNEYFDINSSPQRVWQILRRTRSWIAKAGLALEIEEPYRLKLTGPLRIFMTGEALSSEQLLLRRLALRFTRSFSAGDAMTALEISRATFLRLAPRLKKIGQGKGTRYEITQAA